MYIYTELKTVDTEAMDPLLDMPVTPGVVGP